MMKALLNLGEVLVTTAQKRVSYSKWISSKRKQVMFATNFIEEESH